MDDGEYEVNLGGGFIKGIREGNIFHARGIKYAIGNRFEKPALLEKWEATLDGTKPASVCPQLPSRLNFVTGDIIKGYPMSEDCLHLSICAPFNAIETGARLPVMVFLHGGAYLSGGGDLDCYNPRALANRGIVSIVVTYRLGIFGFCPIQDLCPPNLGLLDQITALKWVQRNISHLGGDPKRVTIIGQSVGAYSIFCMMSCGFAGNLFQRAILHSACFGWPTVPDEKSDILAQTAGSLLAGRGHSASMEDLLEVQGKVMMDGKRLDVPFACWPRFGQDPLPELREVEEKLCQAASKCPILIGWVKDEGAAFAPMASSYSYWSRLPLFGPLFASAMIWWSGGQEFIWPSREFHQKYIQNGGLSSTFVFQWHPRGSGRRAVHCIDVPFILGSWESWKDAPMLKGEGSQETIQRVGDQVKDLWAAFIRGEVTPFREHFNIDGDRLRV
ncbi:para-nitrobenzyl esterase [Pochonia chlamydosporia 170]|uniref:Para-nitrobenzyl esterase n=1 Tax=Pochonia chlamydosporia 170 TaxID=1380566 RepID=A0A179FQ93_METCM|nr:para-nitrobenzyl esterase [Pochonia chlamydosporia 170]OAQ67754.1 para-nitrobenzyl esterase [Pochonia chlamydosporia 170]